MQTLFSVLSAVRSNDIPGVIKAVDSQEIDILVKYLYKLMAFPATYNSSILLAWHEKAIEIGGVGSICRTMTSRQTV